MNLNSRPALLSLLFLLSFLFLMGTCSNGKELQKEGGKEEGEQEKKDAPPLEGTWELQYIKEGAGEAEHPEKPTILRFPSDSSFSMDLKANECQGAVVYSGGQKIRFKDPICTEMCCDTDLQKSLVRLLSDIKHYRGQKERLLLLGDSLEIQWDRGEPTEH